jgi:hypothetical protein
MSKLIAVLIAAAFATGAAFAQDAKKDAKAAPAADAKKDAKAAPAAAPAKKEEAKK